MPLLNIDKLLEEANKYVKDPDVIIDVYDMTYTWTSPYHCEVTGYTKEEQTNMRIAVNSQLVDGDTGHIAPESLHPYQPFVRKIIISTITGETKTTEVHGVVIEVDNHPYLVGKMSPIPVS